MFTVVTTPSKVAIVSVSKLLKILNELKLPIIGVIENMQMKQSDIIINNVSKMGISYLNSIKFDDNLEDSIGKPNLLLETDFMKDFNEIIIKFI